METEEPLANLSFNSRARSQFFDEAEYVHVYVSRNKVLLHGFRTAKSTDSIAYKLVQHRGRALVASLPNNADAMRLLKALFHAGLSDDRSFFRIVKNPGERGWLELELIDRPPKRLEPVMRVTDFIEPPPMENLDLGEWERLLASVDSRQPLQPEQVERFYEFVISAHRILQYHDRIITNSRRKPAKIANAQIVREQFIDRRAMLGSLVAEQPELGDKLERLSVIITGQGLPTDFQPEPSTPEETPPADLAQPVTPDRESPRESVEPEPFVDDVSVTPPDPESDTTLR